MKKIYSSVMLILFVHLASQAQLASVKACNQSGVLQNYNSGFHQQERIQPSSNHSTVLADDVGMVKSYPSPYTMIPLQQSQAITISARVANVGTSSEAHVGYNVSIYLIQNGVSTGLVYSATSDTAATLNAGDTTAVLLAGSYTPTDTGVYYFQYVNFMDNADMNNANDSLYGFIVVNDSTFARDYAEINDSLNNSLGFNAGTGLLGQDYTATTAAVVTSVSFYISHSVIGDHISACIYSVNSTTGIPMSLLRNSNLYTVTAADTNGAFLTLSFPTPVSVSAGQFFAGVNQLTAGHNLGLGECNNIFTPHAAYYHSGSNWVSTDSLFPGSFIVRPNLSMPTDIHENISANAMELYPNPSTGIVHLKNTCDNEKDFSLVVCNLSGEAVRFLKLKNFSGDKP